jgi:CTP-dependent riboflavin kinase
MSKIKVDVDLAKRVLSIDEALDLLAIFTEKRKKRVHSYTSCFIALMGANMDLSQVKKEMKAALTLEDGIENIQIAGSNMNGMGHGVAYWSEKVGWTFLETDKAKLDAIIKKRKITF